MDGAGRRRIFRRLGGSALRPILVASLRPPARGDALLIRFRICRTPLVPYDKPLRYITFTAAVLIAVVVVWTLSPGAGWILRHVDGVHGLKGKDLEDALAIPMLSTIFRVVVNDRVLVTKIRLDISIEYGDPDCDPSLQY